MRPRSILSVYQLAARAWLTAAGLSLLLPASARLGWWLPLHLTLAGAISAAISGAMQNFALTLTSTPAPPIAVVVVQFALVNAGVALLAVGYPAELGAMVVLGGASFVGAMVLLGWVVWRAWRIALNKRHPLPLAMYGAAIAAVLAGGTLGAIVGSRTLHDPTVWLGLRQAHLTLNVLGWVSLTIAGTLITLLPTVLRVRMPSWHGTTSAALLAGGSATIAIGLGVRLAPVAAVGGFAYALGALGVAWLAARAMSTPRTWPVAITAKHFVFGVAWFVVGSVALALAVARGLDAFAAFRAPYLVAFVGGWAVQVLLGAWLYLLPMARPGHPDERRRQLTVTELGGRLQLVALNAGLALMALAGAGWVSEAAGAIGLGLALGGGAIALLKAWCFPVLARAPVLTGRIRSVWGA